MVKKSNSSGESPGFSWAFRDQLIALVLVFMALASLIALDAHKKIGQESSHGLLVIDMAWDLRVEADVDLWVRASADQAVGYSHRESAFCDLLRDDTGRPNDPSSRNEEAVVCRRTPTGEYIVNTMEYASHDGVFPISVTLTISKPGTEEPLLKKTVELTHLGEEITVWRFSLDENGNIVPGSVNDLFMPLRDSGHHG